MAQQEARDSGPLSTTIVAGSSYSSAGCSPAEPASASLDTDVSTTPFSPKPTDKNAFKEKDRKKDHFE
jgi:hypothetical protein